MTKSIITYSSLLLLIGCNSLITNQNTKKSYKNSSVTPVMTIPQNLPTTEIQNLFPIPEIRDSYINTLSDNDIDIYPTKNENPQLKNILETNIRK